MKIQNGISLKPPTTEAKTQAAEGQLRQAAQMYENHFLNEMVKAMRSTVQHDDNSPIKQNFAEKIFSEQLDNQYVDGWTKKGGVGLADMIYNQISDRMKGSGGDPHLLKKGVMPLSPKPEPHGIPAGGDSIQMRAIPHDSKTSEYRFNVPHSSGAAFQAQAPLDGMILEAQNLEDGWGSVKLDHGQGLRSELTFPGRAAPLVSGARVEAGQRLGLVDPTRPTLAWKLEQG